VDPSDNLNMFTYRITQLIDLLGKLNLYDGLFGVTASKQHQVFLHRIIELARLEGSETLLDVGCGTGTLIAEIAKRYPQITMTCIDVSENLLHVAQRKIQQNGDRLALRMASVLELPYQNSTFDTVFTSIMFHQLDLEEKRNAVQEIYRVLKSGGRYVSAEFGPQASNPIRKWLAKGEWTLYPFHLCEAGFSIRHEQLARAMWGKHVFYRIAEKPAV
jgi:ubiquinone/menaquinone biosynthesis C-methylase UbiE